MKYKRLLCQSTEVGVDGASFNRSYTGAYRSPEPEISYELIYRLCLEIEPAI